MKIKNLFAIIGVSVASVANVGCQSTFHKNGPYSTGYKSLADSFQRDYLPKRQPYPCNDDCNNIACNPPAYYGYHPTCWNQWPQDWQGCPPQQLIDAQEAQGSETTQQAPTPMVPDGNGGYRPNPNDRPPMPMTPSGDSAPPAGAKSPMPMGTPQSPMNEPPTAAVPAAPIPNAAPATQPKPAGQPKTTAPAAPSIPAAPKSPANPTTPPKQPTADDGAPAPTLPIKAPGGLLIQPAEDFEPTTSVESEKTAALRSDDELASRIVGSLRELKAEGKLRNFSVDLRVNNGAAHLVGQVPSDVQKQLILETVYSTGVATVDHNIQVIEPKMVANNLLKPTDQPKAEAAEQVSIPASESGEPEKVARVIVPIPRGTTEATDSSDSERLAATSPSEAAKAPGFVVKKPELLSGPRVIKASHVAPAPESIDDVLTEAMPASQATASPKPAEAPAKRRLSVPDVTPSRKQAAPSPEDLNDIL